MADFVSAKESEAVARGEGICVRDEIFILASRAMTRVNSLHEQAIPLFVLTLVVPIPIQSYGADVGAG